MVDDISTDEFLAHHGIKGMKWGVRRYQNPDGTLTAAGSLRYNKTANRIYEVAKDKEPTITKDVVESIENAGGYAHGLEHRLKTADSIARKIDTKGVEHINDALRYTSVSNNDNFVRNYNTIKNELSDKGYKEIKCKNYFDMYDKGLVKHKSVQSQFKDPTGYTFEIQFQTEQSQRAKDKKTPLYEEARSKDVTSSRKKELEEQMVQLAENVPTPKDIQTILSHGGG